MTSDKKYLDELNKKRNELGSLHQKEIFDLNPNGFTVAPYCNSESNSSSFDCGFDAAVEIMMPKIDQLRAALDVAVAALADVSEGHKISKINFDYFNENSSDTSMIKTEILITPETERARQAIEQIKQITNRSGE